MRRSCERERLDEIYCMLTARGESGSGKTENSKRIIQFFAVAAAGGRARVMSASPTRRKSMATASITPSARRTSFAVFASSTTPDMGEDEEAQAALFAKRVSMRRASRADGLMQQNIAVVLGAIESRVVWHTSPLISALLTCKFMCSSVIDFLIRLRSPC